MTRMWPWITWGSFTIPTFVLVQSLNACVILWLSSRRARLQGLPERRALDLVMVSLIFGLLGARLFHVFWENPRYYASDPWKVIDLFSGGYVYYGGFFFGLAGGLITAKICDEGPWGPWFDFVAPLLSLGTGIGRVGCFFAGCCYGKVCDLPWALPNLDESGHWLYRHPTQLYSFAWEMLVFWILLSTEKTPEKDRSVLLRAHGSLFLLWMFLHGSGRFLIEFWRDDFRGPSLFLSISQWISLAFISFALLSLKIRSGQVRLR